MRRVIPVLVVLVGLVGAVAPLAAQGAVPAAPAAQPPAGGDFVPAKDLPQAEQLPAAPLVMGAYAFVWAVLLVYVWTVWRRLMKVEREVKELNARLASKRA